MEQAVEQPVSGLLLLPADAVPDDRWHWTEMASPVGPLLLAGVGDVLRVVGFAQGSMRRGPEVGWRRDPACLAEAREQLAAYFAGELTRFTLALAPRATPFQAKVLAVLATIPYGTTWSYGDIAKVLGNPGASRAVGAANGANPIPVILPCHRVIGSSGKLTGFGGGLPAKEFLLAHEQRHSGLFAP